MPSDLSDTPDLAARREVWTRHWATGAAHSFAGRCGDRYEGEIANYWRRQFEALKPGQHMLDLATGNGALPRLLVEAMPDLDVAIDAVDIATIAPAWTASVASEVRRRLRFLGNVRVEALPFADRGFDLVSSQYGIEYADLSPAVSELVRVCAPGGRIALMMHVVDARPVTLAKVELAHLNWLVSSDGLIAAASGILDPIGRSITEDGRAALATDARAHRARDRFNAAQDALRVRAEARDGADVLFEIQSAVAEAISLALQGRPTHARWRLESVQRAAEDCRLRLEQLCRHALDRAHLAAMCEAIRPATRGDGLIEIGEVRERGHLMGCTLTARLSRQR